MMAALARAVMALAIAGLDETRREWALAMRAEFDVAVAEGEGLRFAIGCLAAAGREMVTRQAGGFTLTNYALVLGVMMPLAALQIGCALFGLPYLYPRGGGLTGALLEGRAQEGLIRSIYQAAIPALTLMSLLLAVGQLRIAWAMLDRDWDAVRRVALRTIAAGVTLIAFMGVLFLDSRQVLLQMAVLAIELATIAAVARWHADLPGGTIPAG